MRVIAGRYRSRPIQSLPGLDIRPTSDRLRETLFDVLCAGNIEALAGSIWFDLYAGTGAVGIEALSRGAGWVTFVESSGKAARLIERNLASLSIEACFTVMQMDVGSALRKFQVAGMSGDYVFLDPPYRMKEAYQDTMEALSKSRLLHASTLVVAEHDRKFDPGEAFGNLLRFRKLEQGDAALSFYKLSPASAVSNE